ncbi:MAG: hypothetical protein EBY44_08680 [Actinobacteria bacterium]|nr:hypothetical protein [Actinomycetota bacterium]
MVEVALVRRLKERVDRVVHPVGVVEAAVVEIEHPACRPASERGGAGGDRSGHIGRNTAGHGRQPRRT